MAIDQALKLANGIVKSDVGVTEDPVYLKRVKKAVEWVNNERKTSKDSIFSGLLKQYNKCGKRATFPTLPQ